MAKGTPQTALNLPMIKVLEKQVRQLEAKTEDTLHGHPLLGNQIQKCIFFLTIGVMFCCCLLLLIVVLPELGVILVEGFSFQILV